MCGYDPFWFYDWLLDRQAEANEHGFETYEDYYNWLEDNKANDDFESRGNR